MMAVDFNSNDTKYLKNCLIKKEDELDELREIFSRSKSRWWLETKISFVLGIFWGVVISICVYGMR